MPSKIETGQKPDRPEFDLVNLPPASDQDKTGQFAFELFETAKMERERLQLPDRWIDNFRLYRGDHKAGNSKKNFVPINLYFANVERTKANITARKPVAEVEDLDGGDDRADVILTAKTLKWWKDTGQQKKLGTTALKMEKYGITIEKPVYDVEKGQADVTIVDCFSFFPAPGHYEDISDECPYVAHAYPEPIEGVEAKFGVDDVEPDDVYSLLGEEREEYRPTVSGTRSTTTSATGNYKSVKSMSSSSTGNVRENRALVIELWIRDANRDLYPDGVRVITFTNSGRLVLADRRNPNINWVLFDRDPTLVMKSHAWGRFPFFKANSYEDTTSIWGFAAAEQVADLNYKIDEIVSRIIAYIMRSINPPLVIPKDIGIKRSQLSNKPGLVLMPTNAAMSQYIRYVPVPNLPSNFFQALEMILGFFDRIYQIEDADRGQAPNGVIAASAIVALQERNAVLIKQKIESVDSLVENRGRWLISFLQNFGVKPDQVDVQDETVPFMGVDFAGRRFNFIVESGSTMPKTTLQTEEQSKQFYQMGAIDRQALLENTNYPGWKEIIERAGEGQLDQALQILIAAGLPEENAMQLKQVLMESQGGPGNRPQNPPGQQQPTSAGMPKNAQGAMPPTGVSGV